MTALTRLCGGSRPGTSRASTKPSRACGCSSATAPRRTPSPSRSASPRRGSRRRRSTMSQTLGVSEPRKPGLSEAALRGLCPQCGARTLFDGWISFASRCRACGLDLASFNVGDGPAAFLTLIVGAIIIALMVWLQLTAAPPWWVHLLLWIPLATAGVIFGLRIGKAALLQSEYHNRAGEGRER